MKITLKILTFTTIVFILAFNNKVFPQSGSKANKIKRLQSLRASDSTSQSYNVKAVIFSQCKDSLIFDIKNKKMFLYNLSKIKYGNTKLTGGRITVNFKKNELEAFGLYAGKDSLKKKLTQIPLLSEGNDNYEGKALKYNFKTKRGFILLAKSKSAQDYYKGEAVKKVSPSVYYIKNGMYTTCNSDSPVTYFTAKEMKVIQKDKIIAKWIFMYVGGVPLPLPIPFAVFPDKKGRKSGIIIPTYGSDALRGQYFHHFGYFFALSDYFDLALTGDYYLRGGWKAMSRFRYAKRYSFSGQINAAYSRIIIGENEDPDKSLRTDWRFDWRHNQKINPSTRLDVNLQYQTSNYFTNNSINYNEILTQDVISNATLSKRWEGGNSLTINYQRIQNLRNGNITEYLPNITFTKTQSYPFRNKQSFSASNMKWYEYIGYSYTARFLNKRIKQNGQLKVHGGVQHFLSISASPKIGYFNITPQFNYTEKWYNKYSRINLKKVQDDNGDYRYLPVTEEVNKINFVRTFNFRISASTKIYGIAQPEALGIKAFRHTLTPTISYNYTPDFSNNKWGYYDYYVGENGERIYYDKFGNEVFGGVSSGSSQSLSLSLGNLFEIKTMKNPNDTTSTEKKIRLLNLTANINYNLAADSLNLSDLSLSYRTQVGKFLNFFGSSSYTFYNYNNGHPVNEFLASAGKGILRLKRFSLSISTTISAKDFKGKTKASLKKPENKGEFKAFKKQNSSNIYEQPEADFTIPWNLSLNLNYSLTKSTPNNVFKSATVGFRLGFNLTPRWKFNISGSYDFIRKEFTAPSINVSRDMDCWQMSFNWYPLGFYRGFHFELRMKAPQLSDIKITRTRGIFSNR